MTTETNRDDLGYLGASFQLKVLWQLLVSPEFAEKIIPNLTASYFDNQLHKFLMNMIKKYHEDHGIPANLKNRSIHEYIKGSNKTDVDKELALGTLNQIQQFDMNTLNGHQYSDAEVVKKTVWFFIKQQECKKIANDIFDKVKTGTVEENVIHFEESFKKVMLLGEDHDLGEDVHHNPEDALKEDYREVIPTGIKAMDHALAGGLGKGEMGIALMPYGVGKTTFLTKAANTAYAKGKNVLQIFFEDNAGDIKRKHYTLWTKIPLSQLKDNSAKALEMVKEYEQKHIESNIGGRLILKKWKTNKDGIPTIPNIHNWIKNYQKSLGIKFDVLFLDYLDCVESHKPTHGDKNEAELVVVKAFEEMIGELNIPGWTAVQGNRSAVRSEYVHGDQMGGNIKRAQKTHFLFSVAKSQEQKANNQANLQFIKSRMTQDGQVYENAIYNNDTLEITLIEGLKASKPKEIDNDSPIFSKAVSKIIDENVREKHKKEEEEKAKNKTENNATDNQLDNNSSPDS